MAALAGALALLLPGGAAAQGEAPRPETRYQVELRLAPAEHRLEATVRLELSGEGDTAFRLLAPLEVAAAEVDGTAVEVRRDGTDLVVPLGEAGPHDVEIVYAGKLSPDRLAGRAGPVVQPEGSFLPAGSGWLPRVGQTRIAYEVAVALPEGQRVLVTGRQQDDKVADGTRRARFAAAYPSVGPTLFAGPYALTTREVDGVTLRTLFPRDRQDNGALAQTYLDATARYLQHYEALIGPYPYPAFSVVAAPFPVGLGFEGATYVSDRILELPYMQGRSLAHEILHSWWGNAVAIAYDQGNWAEGLTTYLADHWVTRQDSLHAAAELRRQWLRDFAALPESRRKPLTAFTFKAHDAAQVTGYNKAAMLFHMLRARLGPELFEAGLKAFYDTHRFDTASWADLEVAFEGAAGQPLGRIFEQWLTRPGAPRLRLETASRRQTPEGWAIDLALAQAPPAYDLRVPVEIATAQGTSRLTLALDQARTETTIELDAKPSALSVDPHADLFHALAPSQVPLTLRHLTLNPETRTVPLGVAPARADDLAAALLDTDGGRVDADAAAAGGMPLLAVGTSETVAAFLERAGFPPPPDQVAGKGTLRAWTAEDSDGRPGLFVAAEDPDALVRGGRRLGYYLRSSWLVIDDGRIAGRGTWETGPDPLRVTFGG
jgi:aminopeptidase N